MSSTKRTYTITFDDGTTTDVTTYNGMQAARSKVSETLRKQHGGIVGMVRAGTGYAVVKTGLSTSDAAWLADYAGIDGTTEATEESAS